MPDHFYTGRAALDVVSYVFNEDVWSQRLSGSLKLIFERLGLGHHFDVTMTGKLGLEFAMYQMLYTGVPIDLCQCYPCHGSPIRNCLIVLNSDDARDEETDFVIENAQQAPRQVPYPPN